MLLQSIFQARRQLAELVVKWAMNQSLQRLTESRNSRLNMHNE
jgi:hypothetical protein